MFRYSFSYRRVIKKNRMGGFCMPKQRFIAMACNSKSHTIIMECDKREIEHW